MKLKLWKDYTLKRLHEYLTYITIGKSPYGEFSPYILSITFTTILLTSISWGVPLKGCFSTNYSKSEGEQPWRTAISVYIIIHLYECWMRFSRIDARFLDLLYSRNTSRELLLVISKLIFGHVYLKVLSCKSNGNNQMITSTQTRNLQSFSFLLLPVVEVFPS